MHDLSNNITTTPTSIEEKREAEKDEKIRAILDSQKPWHEYRWQGSTDPLIMALAR